MQNMKLRKLVDEGRSIKDKIDALEARQEEIKKVLREEAKKRKIDFFLGEEHFARISPQTTTFCDSKEFYDMMVDLGREAEFFEGVNVQIGKAKAALGETVFMEIADVESIPYKKVSFLLKPPKKYVE